MPGEKQHAHEPIEQLPPPQLSAVVGLLEAAIDPVARKLAAAPIDDELETDDERQATTVPTPSGAFRLAFHLPGKLPF